MGRTCNEPRCGHAPRKPEDTRPRDRLGDRTRSSGSRGPRFRSPMAPMLGKMEAIARRPWPPGEPPDFTLRGIARWQARQREIESQMSPRALADKARLRRKAHAQAELQRRRDRDGDLAFQEESRLSAYTRRRPGCGSSRPHHRSKPTVPQPRRVHMGWNRTADNESRDPPPAITKSTRSRS